MPGKWPELVEEIREKRPSEELILPIDFNNRLAPGDSITGTPLAVCVKEWGQGGQLGIGGPGLIAGVWFAEITGGDAPSDHRFSVVAGSVGGNVFEHVLMIQIRT